MNNSNKQLRGCSTIQGLLSDQQSGSLSLWGGDRIMTNDRAQFTIRLRFEVAVRLYTTKLM